MNYRSLLFTMISASVLGAFTTACGPSRFEVERQKNDNLEESKIREFIKSSQEKKLPLIITRSDAYTWRANDLRVGFTGRNISGKTIKYVRLSFSTYNAVGDPLYCEVTKRNRFTCSLTGPIAASTARTDYSGGSTMLDPEWHEVAYLPQFSSSKKGAIRDFKLEVDYMDGSKDVVSGDRFQQMLFEPNRTWSFAGEVAATQCFNLN